ncbi:MAG TPA: hypothetical protein VEY10_19060 [Flavisolibacter sp.]|jgi:putative Mn2+ efflux pump MntP|nr:hypothetical protein [Flavisolibacter sp.]
MTFYLLDGVTTAQFITHPISLIAFVTAIVFGYFSVRNDNKRKQIESAPPERRADVIIQTAHTLHINLQLIPEQQRAGIVLKELNIRFTRYLIGAVVVVILGLFITYLVSHQIDTQQTKVEKFDPEPSIGNESKKDAPITNITLNMDSVTKGVQAVGDSNTIEIK